MRPALLACLLGIAAAPAAAQPTLPPPCLTAAQATTLIRFAWPTVLGATLARCSAILGRSSYLAREGGTIARRFPPVMSVTPELRRLLAGISGMDLPDSVSDAGVADLARTTIGGMVAAKLGHDQCDRIDQVLALVGPASADSMEQMLLLLAQMGDIAGSDLRFCPPQDRR